MRGLDWAGWSVSVVLVGLAASPVEAAPAVLYVPTEDVLLRPLVGECAGFGSSDSSALGCTSSVEAPEMVPPWPEAEALREQLAGALAAYDVHIAEERPPEYLAYTMLLPSDEPQPRSQDFTCSRGGINCGARKRNDIVWVSGPTQNCLVSDVLLASIYAFGRASGLEGVSDPLDAMYYVPDFAMGTGTFVDACSPLVQQLGFDDMGQQIVLPLECPSIDHPGCPAGQQNAHAELLAVYGPRTVDEDPPVMSNLQPGDGAVFRPGATFVADVDLSDADPVVGGRWTVSSPLTGGEPLTICTNDVCDGSFADATPLKPTASDWSIGIAGAPEGVYEITFEAADFHGNVAEPVSMVVYVGEGPPPGTSGGWDSGDVGSEGLGSSDDEAGFTTGMTAGTSVGPGPGDDTGGGGGPADGSTSGEPEADDGLVPHGCLCAASRSGSGGGWWWAVVGLLGLRRMRRAARDVRGG